MQTFLPFDDYGRTASILDRQRLGKQRVETLQIMKALVLNEGWVNHPATRMWKGYEGALFLYQTAICGAWMARGYKDNCHQATRELLWDTDFSMDEVPPWLGDPAFHMSHQSNLLRKDPVHYEYLVSPNTPPDLPYQWPNLKDDGTYVLVEGKAVA